MNINKIILALFLLLVGFTTIKYSFGLFTSAASNNNNTFTASSSFPTLTPTVTLTLTPTPTSINHLLINEVYLLGDFEDEWVELYNPSVAPVSVNSYKIEDNDGSDTLPDVLIPAGGYGVITGNDSVNVVVPSPAVQIQVANANIGGHGLNNNGDKLILRDENNGIVDQMGYGTDPDIFPGLIPPTVAGNSLARHPNGTDTDAAGDWQIQSSTIGVANP